MEEKFFYMYHLKLNYNLCMALPIYERKWYVEKFIQQKERENEMMRKGSK